MSNMQRHSQECHDKEIEELRDSQKEQEKSFKAEKERLKEQEQHKRLREKVISFFQSQYQSSLRIEWKHCKKDQIFHRS